MKNHLRAALFACAVLLCNAAAHAAPTDCIGQSSDGKAICQPPELTPQAYGACIMANASNIDSATGYCNQLHGLVNSPGYTEAPVVAAQNCTYQRVTFNTNSPVTAFAWKAEGQAVDGGSLCWTGTVKWKYGVEMLGFAEQSPPGWYKVHGLRTRKSECRAGESPVYGSDGYIDYCSLAVVNSSACTAGNPTDPALGTKLERSTDYAGAGAHPLGFERLYRSTWYPQLPLNRVGGFWAHNYGASARLLPAATYGTRYAFATRADGEHHVYTNTTGTWVPATATRNTLSEQRDTAGTLTGLQLQIWQDDSTETYDLEGRLLSIRQRNGWTATLTYSNAATPAAIAPKAGLLISVKNQFGRELRFTYDAQDRMTELLPPGAVSGTGAGSATSPIRYAYDEAASLGPGVTAQGQLSSVMWQDGSVRRYHHEQADVWYIASGPHLLTGITDEVGVRYATWVYGPGTTYDIYLIGARVVRSEHAGGTDKLEFAYSNNTGSGPRTTTITDYSSGSAQQTIHTYTQQGNSYKPSAVSASCPQCGNTAQAMDYNAAGDKSKQIAHDGSVTFIAYDARGRETERATFAASYASATTRPALANATRVVSTKWHATFNLPTQVAEPNKTTANTYNGKGMLTGTSWTATTDATGAAKFTAVKTGSTYATGWSYSASNLITTAISKVDAVETQRYTMAYAANGDLTRITDVTAGNRIGRATSYDAQGRLLQATTIYGDAMSFVYSPRGFVTSRTEAGKTTTFLQNAIGYTREVRMPDGKVATFEIDSTRRLRAVRIDGALISANAIRDGAQTSPFLAHLLEQLQRGVEAVVPPAQAQAGVVVDLPLPWPVPGQPQIGQPQGDPEDNLIGQAITGGSSKFGKQDQAVRRLLEAITAICTCDPNGGYNSPKLTPTSYAHIAITGHLGAANGNKSYFTEPVNQTLVDEVARRAAQPDPQGDQDVYVVPDMGRVVGLTRTKDPADPSGPWIFVPTRTVTMYVTNTNCANLFRKRNEVVTMFPGETKKP